MQRIEALRGRSCEALAFLFKVSGLLYAGTLQLMRAPYYAALEIRNAEAHFCGFTGFSGLRLGASPSPTRMHRARPVPCCTAGFGAHREKPSACAEHPHVTNEIWIGLLPR